MNGYFDYSNNVVPGSLGRAEAVGELFELVEKAFDKLPTPAESGQGFSGPLVVGTPTDPTHALPLGMHLSWTQDVNGNGHRLINIATPLADGDAANRGFVNQQIAAYLTAGADVGSIPITSLGKGVLAPGQAVRLNGTGTALEPFDPSTGGIDFDLLQPDQPIRVSPNGESLTSYDDTLISASAALYAYENF